MVADPVVVRQVQELISQINVDYVLAVLYQNTYGNFVQLGPLGLGLAREMVELH